MKKYLRQLCWDCERTNKFECEWFADCSKVPDYCTTDSKGFIIKCERFKKLETTNFHDLATPEEIAEFFGVSVRTYYRHKKYYNQVFNIQKSKK